MAILILVRAMRPSHRNQNLPKRERERERGTKIQFHKNLGLKYIVCHVRVFFMKNPKESKKTRNVKR